MLLKGLCLVVAVKAEDRGALAAATEGLRLAVRQSHSAPILRRRKKALFKLKPCYLPKESAGQSLRLARKTHRKKLPETF